MKSGYVGHDSMREKAERAFSSSDCYKSGGKVHHGRIKKDIGGEIQKAGIMGLPSYLIDGVGDAIKGLKSGGKASHKPVRRNMGGTMGVPSNTADSIQQANQILSNAASNGVGLKRGGQAHPRMRHKHADGGAINAMGQRDFDAGKKAMGFNHGGSAESHCGDRVKRAIGGVGKIRHGQMTRGGAQIAPRCRHKG